MAVSPKKTVAVVGLGYVGLPLAVRASERGYTVIGFDTNQEKIALLNQGKSPIEDSFLEQNITRFRFDATSDPKKLKVADIFLICVPTPVDESFYPDLKPVITASELIAAHAKKGALVVLESTVNPGVSAPG
jgi:nucleotide sugar dehydrogenase